MTGETPTPTPFRLIREKGTVRLVLGAILLSVAWYAYNSYRVYRMQQVRWPALTAVTDGLTVVGLQDKDRPGKPRKYVAIEANHAWQIRRPDDAGEDESEMEEPEEKASYQPTAAVSSRTASGQVVSVEEVLATCPVVLTAAHFSSASMEQEYEPFRDTHYYKVHVTLTPEGRSRYWQFSRDHDEERLAFIMKGDILTCPKMSHMDTTSLTIEPIWVKEDADTLVRVLGGKP